LWVFFLTLNDTAGQCIVRPGQNVEDAGHFLKS
jgi:hypothetical protein